MKIAYIGIKGLPSKGGAERVVEAIVKRLCHEHEITVYCSSRYTLPTVVVSGVRLIRVPCIKGRYSHMMSVNLMAAFHAVIYGNYDLIHLHNIEASFILPILKLKYPVITTAHGRMTSENKWGRFSLNIIQSMEIPYSLISDVMTSVSLKDANELSRRSHKKVIYIPNGIEKNTNIDEEGSKIIINSYGLNGDDYILFAAGRIIPVKGVHILLTAFKSIGQDCKLLIIGDNGVMPEYTYKLKSIATSQVIFIPFISSPSILFGFIKLCRFFVSPSISEGMSMALLEAASLGVPIICSDIQPNKDIFSPCHAIFFKKGNTEDLKEKLTWAIANPPEMKTMGSKAQKWVKEKFSWDTISDQYDQLYKNFV